MTIGNLLIKEYPGSINREGLVFSSLVANSKQNGTFETELKLWRDFAELYTQNYDIYKMKDDILDKTVEYFSFLKRYYNETDEKLIKRFKALFYRGADKTWGTPFDIKHLFSEYFSGKVFLLENTNDFKDNLISNGDFEDDNLQWVLSNSVIDSDSRFSGKKGVKLGLGSISQNVSLDNNYVYFIHFFHKGKLNPVIYNTSTSKYWNIEEKQWVNNKPIYELNKLNWDSESFYFSLKNIESGVSDINIKFEGTSEDSCVDFILLFKKNKHCSFTVINYNEGDIAEGSLALAEGTIDNPDLDIPHNVNVKVENWGFYNQTYITGPASGYASDIFNDMLDYVKTLGYKAYIEFITKEVSV